ncbi:MAG: hypothetical protein H6642_04795 [Caldilineaceae bacterium]|nr:hypothetical protein [Caldilineaceae bacterium]
MSNGYSVGQDALYPAVVALFAVVTTALPAAFGQPLLLHVLQTLALTLLLGIALRSGSFQAGMRTLAVWIGVQALLMAMITFFFGDQAARAIPGGFDLGAAMIEWLYTANPLPNGIAAAPVARTIEFLGITIGSLLTGGLIGGWFLTGAVNQAAFISGTLLASLDQDVSFLVAFLPWSILVIAGYAGLLVCCAAPVWRSDWSVIRFQGRCRPILLAALALLIAGLLSELLLPDAWRALFV